jgi:uncharacterized protein (TIGR00297 family)
VSVLWSEPTRFIPLLWGFIGSSVIALYAWRKGALTISGAVGAVIIGTVFYGFGGVFYSVLLLLFFTTSTALTYWRIEKKLDSQQIDEKSGGRDIWQVMANGGLPALFLAFGGLFEPLWMIVAIGMIATANSDTWATEIGKLSKSNPRHILTGKRLPTGTSGGVSLLGFVAAWGGSAIIALAAMGLVWLGSAPEWIKLKNTGMNIDGYIGFALSISISGWVGALMDSVLGATVQRKSKCLICHIETEKTRHCRQRTQKVKGLSWVNNDMVNGVSTFFGGMLLLYLW